MDDRPRDSPGEPTVLTESVPGGLGDGATVLVASAGTPVRDLTCLRLLCRYGDGNDTALVVTTTESADQTLVSYGEVGAPAEHPSLGLVDTVSEQQSISAVYDETPVVYTPSRGDLERLVLALSELSGGRPPSDGSRHLVVRSLTPVLDASPIRTVSAVLERVTGLPSARGLCLLGLDYTAHGDETIASLAEQVDGILWVTRSRSDRLEFEYRPARAHQNPPVRQQ